MERNMAEKGVGFLAAAAKVEGAVQTARYRYMTVFAGYEILLGRGWVGKYI